MTADAPIACSHSRSMETLHHLPPLPTGHERHLTINDSASRDGSRGTPSIYPQIPGCARNKGQLPVYSKRTLTCAEDAAVPPTLRRHLSALLSPSLTRRALSRAGTVAGAVAGSAVVGLPKGASLDTLTRLTNDRVQRVRHGLDASSGSSRDLSSDPSTPNSRRRALPGDNNNMSGLRKGSVDKGQPMAKNCCHDDARVVVDINNMALRVRRDRALTRGRLLSNTPSGSEITRRRLEYHTRLPSAVHPASPRGSERPEAGASWAPSADAELTMSPEMFDRCRSWLLGVQSAKSERAIDVTPPVIWNE